MLRDTAFRKPRVHREAFARAVPTHAAKEEARHSECIIEVVIAGWTH